MHLTKGYVVKYFSWKVQNSPAHVIVISMISCMNRRNELHIGLMQKLGGYVVRFSSDRRHSF